MVASLIVGIISFLLVLGIKSRTRPELGLFWAFVVVTIFMAIHYDWGNDYMSYLNVFNEISRYEGSWTNLDMMSSFINNGEVGWALLNYAFRPVGFFGMIIFLSVFENVIIYRFIKKHVEPQWYWFAFIIYFFNTSFMLMQASMLRQWLAMALFLWSFEYIIKRKIIPFAVLIFIAMNIHNSAIILFAFYFIPYFKTLNLSYKKVLVLLPFFFFYIYWIPQFFASKFPVILESVENFDNYAIYAEDNLKNTNFSLAVSLSYCVSLISLAQMNKANDRMKILILVSFMATLIQPLISVIHMVGRVNSYFFMANLAVLPFTVDTLWKEYRLIAIGVLSFLLVFYIYNFIIFFSNGVWFLRYFEYHTIFEVPWQ